MRNMKLTQIVLDILECSPDMKDLVGGGCMAHRWTIIQGIQSKIPR
jgi:hypothetical protein